MNKTQILHLISSIRKSDYTNSLDELKLVLHLLNESPYVKEYEALENIIKHIRGIISLELDKRNALTQRQFDEVYN